MICPGCQAEVPDEDSFCENCGLRLGPPPEPAPACLCGASLGEADEDGFCQQCGRRVRRPASDHIEQAISPDLAGISDRGLHHDHNEDRFALVREARGVGLVVCDGVSSTSQAEVAAETVAQTIAAELRGILADDRPEAPLEEAAGTLLGAMAKGGAALEAQTTGNRWSTTAPSTTVVAAMVVGRELTVAWAGDSRAYWIGEDHQVEALTRDHSWLRVALSEGRLTAQEALGSPQAHAILRWVGADADPDNGPEIVQRTLEAPGWLLLCSDGLWNYAPDEEELGALLARASATEGAEALPILQQVVAFANDQGGQDNITAVLLRWMPPALSEGLDSFEPTNLSLRTGEGEG